MEINEKLKEAGLTGNETKVYLELIKNGNMSANQIAKNIGMDRTLTYTVLNHLIEKGQISYIIKEKKKIFSCSSPENLLNSLKTKEVIIFDLIKDLKKIKIQEQQHTEVNVYEGKEGIRTLMKQIIKAKQFSSFGGTGRAYDLLYEMPAITKQIEKTKASAKVIINPESQYHEFTKHKNIKIRISNIKSEATTTIFGNCIAVHIIKNKPLAIVIKNKDIADSYRAYFNVLWEQAKP